jgi:hypothetical protein
MIWRSGDPKANKCEGGTQLQSKPFYIKGFPMWAVRKFPHANTMHVHHGFGSFAISSACLLRP